MQYELWDKPRWLLSWLLELSPDSSKARGHSSRDATSRRLDALLLPCAPRNRFNRLFTSSIITKSYALPPLLQAAGCGTWGSIVSSFFSTRLVDTSSEGLVLWKNLAVWVALKTTLRELLRRWSAFRRIEAWAVVDGGRRAAAWRRERCWIFLRENAMVVVVV